MGKQTTTNQEGEEMNDQLNKLMAASRKRAKHAPKRPVKQPKLTLVETVQPETFIKQPATDEQLEAALVELDRRANEMRGKQ